MGQDSRSSKQNDAMKAGFGGACGGCCGGCCCLVILFFIASNAIVPAVAQGLMANTKITLSNATMFTPKDAGAFPGLINNMTMHLPGLLGAQVEGFEATFTYMGPQTNYKPLFVANFAFPAQTLKPGDNSVIFTTAMISDNTSARSTALLNILLDVMIPKQCTAFEISEQPTVIAMGLFIATPKQSNKFVCAQLGYSTWEGMTALSIQCEMVDDVKSHPEHLCPETTTAPATLAETPATTTEAAAAAPMAV